MPKAAKKSTARGLVAAPVSISMIGTGQTMNANVGQSTLYSRFIRGINPRATTTIMLVSPRGATRRSASMVWIAENVSLTGGPKYDIRLICETAPPSVPTGLIDGTLTVTNDGNSSSIDETVEIDVTISARPLIATTKKASAKKAASKQAPAKKTTSKKTKAKK